MPAGIQKQIETALYDTRSIAKPAAAHREAESAVAKHPVRNGPLGAHKGEARYAGRCRVSITSHRRTLLDPDNLCVKWFIDALRYSGIIGDDRAQDIELSVRQEKVFTPADERTEILIEPIHSPATSRMKGTT